VGFEGLPILGQPSPNRPSAVRKAHSAARRGRASHSHLGSKACAPTPQLAQSAASAAICPGRARVAMSDQTLAVPIKKSSLVGLEMTTFILVSPSRRAVAP